MCLGCHGFASNRRQFLSLAAASLAASALFGERSAFATDATTNVTADQAIARLKAASASCPLRMAAPGTPQAPNRRDWEFV